MSSSLPKCACSRPLVTANIETKVTPKGATITLCPECDKPQCTHSADHGVGRCRGRSPDFFPKGPWTCPVCGNKVY